MLKNELAWHMLFRDKIPEICYLPAPEVIF